MNKIEDTTKKEDEITEKADEITEKADEITEKADEITEKADEITEKDESTEDVCTDEDTDRDIIDDIKSIFEDPDCAYPLNDVIDGLKVLGYKNPGGAITLALQDEAIYVDSVEDSGMVYLAAVEKDEEE